MPYDGAMARRTAASQPIAVRIADDLRIEIEQGRLAPGAAIPTLHDLAKDYSCALGTARTAVALLKQQGLITGGRGKAPTVRGRPRRVERSSARHQQEKNLVMESEDVRRARGLAEDDIGSDLSDISVEANYSVVPSDADLADAFRLPEGTSLLRREYTHRHRDSGILEAWSLSWLPHDLISQNPDIFDPDKAAWPGGTMHQLLTVGIEIIEVIDHVTAAMPTTVEAQAWELPEGTPLMWVRRISIDTEDRVVEVSDAQYPADRTMLTFHTTLTRWDHP